MNLEPPYISLANKYAMCRGEVKVNCSKISLSNVFYKVNMDSRDLFRLKLSDLQNMLVCIAVYLELDDWRELRGIIAQEE